MKSRLSRLMEDCESALKALEEGVAVAKSDLEIEGAIKRFELTYELAWRLIKELLEILGVVCRNPRLCFKLAYENGLIQEQEVWLRMIENRNRLVHVYSYWDSRQIFENVRKNYLGEFIKLKERVEGLIKEVGL